MGAYYGTKIKNGEICYKTGQPYTINDVPKWCRAETEEWLKTH